MERFWDWWIMNAVDSLTSYKIVHSVIRCTVPLIHKYAMGKNHLFLHQIPKKGRGKLNKRLYYGYLPTTTVRHVVQGRHIE